MKKIVCILVLTCVVMGGVFAQQSSEAKNAVAMDVFRLFDGLTYFEKDGYVSTTLSFSYERAIVPHWSIGPNFDMGFGGEPYHFTFRLGLAAEGRYYPFANFDKFFVGTTLGFIITAHSYARGYGYDEDYLMLVRLIGVEDSIKIPDNKSYFGLNVMLKAGYKLITSKKFYMEPSLAYGYRAGSPDWQGGLRLGVAF